jgi:hypothetical protein
MIYFWTSKTLSKEQKWREHLMTSKKLRTTSTQGRHFFTPAVREHPNLQYIQGSSTEEEDHGVDIKNTELYFHLSPSMSFVAARDDYEYLQPIQLEICLICSSYCVDQIKIIISSRQSTMMAWSRSGIVNVSLSVLNFCTSDNKCFKKHLIIPRSFTQSWKEGETKEKLYGSGHQSCVMMV